MLPLDLRNGLRGLCVFLTNLFDRVDNLEPKTEKGTKK